MTERFSIAPLAARIRALKDIDDGANLDHSIDRLADDVQTVTGIVTDAVTALLDTHARTGIDLTQWPGVYELITIVHPHIVIEGTGPTDENSVTSEGETGRYWLNGDTSQPCNSDAWGAEVQRYSPGLGYTH